MKDEKGRSNLKIIIDTNIFISFLINTDFNFIFKLINDGKIDLIISEELVGEIVRVSSRPKFLKYILKEQVNLLTEILLKFGVLVKVVSDINVCRDKNDNFLLALARDSNADFILTGDKDLLSLHKFENTFIVKIAELKQLVKNV
ncbi:MAG: putative toxin-antitoxin system toxin component, PIN family [Bacteroidetes bacterium]|nr:putative toxin-antitoxin system toxin component, PIN family [Bacteroidota bacterium]